MGTALVSTLAAVLVIGLVALAVFRTRRLRRRGGSWLWDLQATGCFLPACLPPVCEHLSAAEGVLARLPSLLSSGQLIGECQKMPRIPLARLLRRASTSKDAEQIAERAMVVFSFLSYAFLRAADTTVLPANLAVPWAAASRYVRRAPSLDYVTTVLININPAESATDHAPATFSGLTDERFFYELHARIEEAARPAVGAMLAAMRQLTAGTLDGEQLGCVLASVARGLRAMIELMPKMLMGCDPYVFHTVIRGSLAGLEKPVTFMGVAGTPSLKLGGASGAQSPLIPCFDAFLGVCHHGPHEPMAWSVEADGLSHMPPEHRSVLLQMRASAPASATRVQLVAALMSAKEACHLLQAHDACLSELKNFRKAHVKLVRSFIISPAAQKTASPTSPPAVVAKTSLSSEAYPISDELGPKDSRSEHERTSSPQVVHAPLVGTGGSELVDFLSGRLVDTAHAAVTRLSIAKQPKPEDAISRWLPRSRFCATLLTGARRLHVYYTSMTSTYSR